MKEVAGERIGKGDAWKQAIPWFSQYPTMRSFLKDQISYHFSYDPKKTTQSILSDGASN